MGIGFLVGLILTFGLAVGCRGGLTVIFGLGRDAGFLVCIGGFVGFIAGFFVFSGFLVGLIVITGVGVCVGAGVVLCVGMLDGMHFFVAAGVEVLFPVSALPPHMKKQKKAHRTKTVAAAVMILKGGTFLSTPIWCLSCILSLKNEDSAGRWE